MVECHNCGKHISSKDDANVLAFLGFVPHVFCNSCYSQKERQITRHFFYSPKNPINGTGYLFFSIILTIALMIGWVILLFSPQGLVAKNIFFTVGLIVIIYMWALRIAAMSKLSGLK